MSDSSDDMAFYSAYCDEEDDYDDLLAHRDNLLEENAELKRELFELREKHGV